MPRLNIIGAGQVGQCLGYLLTKKANIRIQSVLNRSLASAEKACEFIGEGQPCQDFNHLKPADYYLIGVHDHQIATVAEQLKSHVKLASDNLVFHCSGALSSKELAVIAATGAATASFHPLKSFIDPQLSVDSFAGTTCTIEGSPVALEIMRKWINLIGANCLEINAEAKLLYHAGAVFAGNYLAAITATALDCWQQIGIDPQQGLQALTPYLQTSLQQLLDKGPTEALTGVIARGDAGLVQQQIAALADFSGEITKLYKQLGKVALKLASAKKNPAANLVEIADLFTF